MSQTTLKGEHLTAVVSTIVAIAILAAGVTAQQQHAAPRDIIVQLESDFRFQLNNAFRHDLGVQQERLALLNQAVAAWQASSQSEVDRKLLADWLLESTIRSMPGTVADLPEIPSFGAAVTEAIPHQDRETSASPSDARVRRPAEVKQASTVPTRAEFLASSNTNVEPFNEPQLRAESSLLVPTADDSGSFSPAQSAAAEADVPVQINLRELAARIAGYHVGLDEIESHLLTLEEADLDVLADFVRHLEDMARDFRFVKLYYDALTEAERRAIASPRSMQITLREIDRQITRSEKAQRDDFLGEFEGNREERTKQLRQQLAVLLSRSDW